jgi:hypothetical protein
MIALVLKGPGFLAAPNLNVWLQENRALESVSQLAVALSSGMQPLNSSPEGAKFVSPTRERGVRVGRERAPEERHISCDTVSLAPEVHCLHKHLNMSLSG